MGTFKFVKPAVSVFEHEGVTVKVQNDGVSFHSKKHIVLLNAGNDGVSKLVSLLLVVADQLLKSTGSTPAEIRDALLSGLDLVEPLSGNRLNVNVKEVAGPKSPEGDDVKSNGVANATDETSEGGAGTPWEDVSASLVDAGIPVDAVTFLGTRHRCIYALCHTSNPLSTCQTMMGLKPGRDGKLRTWFKPQFEKWLAAKVVIPDVPDFDEQPEEALEPITAQAAKRNFDFED